MSIEETNFDSIDTMRTSFKNKIHSIMEERVPTKMTQSRYTHPWLNRKIRRLIGENRGPIQNQEELARRETRIDTRDSSLKYSYRLGNLTRDTCRKWSAKATKETQRSFGPL